MTTAMSGGCVRLRPHMWVTVVRVAILLSCVTTAQTLLWDDCQMPGSRRSLDLMVAMAVTPVEDRFPFNLFQTSRMPDAVTQFIQALLPVFDYLHTRVSVVALDTTFKTITPFINNRYRILTTVKRWEPTVKRGLAPADLRSIRAMFNRDARADVVKVLVLVVDQPPQDIDGLMSESQLLQDDDVFVLIIAFSAASRHGDTLRQLTTDQDELIAISSAYHLPTRVRPVKSALCVVIAKPTTTAVPTTITTQTTTMTTTTALPTTTTTESPSTTITSTTPEITTTTTSPTTTTAVPTSTTTTTISPTTTTTVPTTTTTTTTRPTTTTTIPTTTTTTTTRPTTTTTIPTTTTTPATTTTTRTTVITDPPDGIFEEVIILADESESTRDFLNMTSHYSDALVSFLRTLISKTVFDHCKLGLAFFSDDVRIVAESGTNKSQLLSALDSLDSSQHGFSTTNLGAALRDITSKLNTSLSCPLKTILVMTDGQPDDLEMTSAAVMQARETVPELRFVWVLSPLVDGQIAYRRSDYDGMTSASTDRTFTATSRERLGSLSIDDVLCQGRPKT